MIDTIRLVGDANYYKFNYDYQRFVGWKRKDGTEKITEVMVENKKGVHRIWFSPHTNLITVELNPQKLMFGANCFNYETNSNVLNDFVRTIGSVYFGAHSFYVARVDLGGVVTYPDIITCSSVLEKYRSFRPEGQRVSRFKQQNYKDSAFYGSRNYSIKVYNKGAEMGYKTTDSIEARSLYGFDLSSTLRFEKTYRFNEMKRLGMQKTTGKGIYIDSFDISILVDDFYNVFKNWTFGATPYITNSTGYMGLLSIIENTGNLSEVESLKVVSRMTISRYRKKKRENAKQAETTSFELQNNLPQKVLNLWSYYRTFGITNLIHGS